MSVSETPTSLYCLHCGTSKRIFLSTQQEEIESFKSYHSLCCAQPPNQPPDPFQRKDWKLRGSQPNEDRPK